MVTVKPARRFSGSLRVPSDKSLTHRAVFFSALAKGRSVIINPLPAADCLSTVSCMRALGAKIVIKKNRWTVESPGSSGFRSPGKDLYCGNSGTTMRLISGILAGQLFQSVLTGDPSLSRRPMDRVALPLVKMGARLSLRNKRFPPVTIDGSLLQAIQWTNKVASAQVKSCVLLAGLRAPGETIYREPQKSRDHTERMLKACGAPIKVEGNTIRLKGPAELRPQTWTIPGDISSAAFFIVAGLLVSNSSVRLVQVNLNPTRTGILDVLKKAGAKIQIVNQKTLGGEPVGDLVIKGPQKLKAFRITEEISPRLIDEVPILAIAATQARGTSVFSGLEELRFKETDRIKAMVDNLKAMGAKVQEKRDGFSIQGPVRLKGGVVNSFDDHRIAMAFAIAGLVADGPTRIKGSDAVAISFPTFWTLLRDLC